jgi:uncharacterized protein involved in type VI secretion and phage assembly
MSAVQCEVQFQGNADATVGSIVALENLGNFSGSAFVSAVKHELTDGYWSTTINTGLPATSPNEEPAPTTSGIQLGAVKKLEGDPENGGRILVTLAIDSSQQVWARMASFYATSNHGFAFYPEIGDEVVLGLIDNDPSALVILGSLYSKKNPVGNLSNDKNDIKSITTRSGVSIEIDDEHKSIEIKTPGNNSFRLDDEKKEVLLSDQNGNKIQLDASGISFESPKDIYIKANGDINMNAKGNIKIESSFDTSVQAMNIKEHADVGIEIKGNATAELSASGQTTVKGAMVMIN